jgi:hypothetical protein
MAPQWLTIAQHGPEIPGFRPAAPRIEHPIKHGGGGLIHIKPGTARLQQHRHAIHHRGDQRARPAHPVGQNRPLDRHTEPGHDHRLPVQRHVFGMFGHRNLRQKRLGRPTALQQMCRGLGLNHARAPLGAGVFRAHRDNHLIARRNEVEPFRPVLPDPHHIAATTRATNAVRFDQALHARQCLGQRPRFAWHARGSLVRISRAGRDLFLDGGNLRLRFGNRGFQVFQRQFQLRGVELF